jgi:colicin import membrane protein
VAEEDTVPPPQPIPEPKPQDSPVPRQSVAQERIPVPDTQDQEEASRLALSQEKALREQEAKRRQEQIDLTEQKRVEEAQKQQRLAQQQEEADKQKKLDEIRRMRAQAAKDAQLAEQKLRQLADARAQQAAVPAASTGTGAPAGNNGTDDGLLAKYVAAIQQQVSGQWTRPDSVPPGTRCRVVIKQLPGGQVMSAEVQPGCPMDRAGQDSLERAVLKAQPLPYRGFETVFNRTLNFNFTAQDR